MTDCGPTKKYYFPTSKPYSKAYKFVDVDAVDIAVVDRLVVIGEVIDVKNEDDIVDKSGFEEEAVEDTTVELDEKKDTDANDNKEDVVAEGISK